MAESLPSTDEILAIVSGAIVPLFAIERTMVIPPDGSRHENVAEHS